MPQAQDCAHRAIAPRLAPARRYAVIISCFDVFANGAGGFVYEKVAIGEIIQNLLIKYMVCDMIKMDIYNWHIYAFSAVLCY